jgi:PAS domain S-box-containing protein
MFHPTYSAPPKRNFDPLAKPAIPPRSRLILPVEDERIVARDLQMRLHKLGYEVPSVASSKAEALEVLRAIHPDLVLMDIQLNGVPEGIDAAREIQECFDIPVIYLTAHSDRATLDLANESEPFGYVLKPFQDRELWAAIETAIHKHGMESRLRDTESRLRHQAELIGLSHDAIITTDPNRVVTAWNAGAKEIFGWTEREATGRFIHELLRTEPASSLGEMQLALSRQGRWDGELIHTGRDGSRIFTESRQVLLRSESGETIGILGIDRDISDRKRAQAELETSLSHLGVALTEKTVLLREVHHRVKNNLAVISSLLSMKADATDSVETRQALEESQQRVRSIALIHEHLYGTAHLDRINMADYADQLAGELAMALGTSSRGIAIRVNAQPIELEVKHAVPCALILNELVTNALKHAFPGNRTGEVSVSLRRPESGVFELAVEDDGVGGADLSGDGATVRSLGKRIINILARQLEGTFQQEPSSGSRFVLRFATGS